MEGTPWDAVFPTRVTPSEAGGGLDKTRGPESARGTRANTGSRQLRRDAWLAWVSCRIYAIKMLFKSTEHLKVKCWCEMTSPHQTAWS